MGALPGTVGDFSGGTSVSDFNVTVHDPELVAVFQKIFGTTTVDVLSPVPIRPQPPQDPKQAAVLRKLLGEPQPWYLLDMRALTAEQIANLIRHWEDRECHPDTISQWLTEGVPLQVKDTTLTILNPQTLAEVQA
jgi:hypothetical protein